MLDMSLNNSLLEKKDITMKRLLILLTLLISIPSYAEYLGKTFKAVNKWVDIQNNRPTYAKGSSYPSRKVRCRINEDQQLRVVGHSKDKALIRLIGFPSRSGTNCPKDVLFILEKRNFLKWKNCK
jgi:hypothetical protein